MTLQSLYCIFISLSTLYFLFEHVWPQTSGANVWPPGSGSKVTEIAQKKAYLNTRQEVLWI